MPRFLVSEVRSYEVVKLVEADNREQAAEGNGRVIDEIEYDSEPETTRVLSEAPDDCLCVSDAAKGETV